MQEYVFALVLELLRCDVTMEVTLFNVLSSLDSLRCTAYVTADNKIKSSLFTIHENI